MRTVTNYYGITGRVPFLNVDVDNDNELFVDLSAIRLERGPEPYRELALNAAGTFLEEIVDGILDGSPPRLERAHRMLLAFREPWQTRLGFTSVGSFGRGGAEWTGDELFRALTEDAEALTVVGILQRLDQIPIFVEGIGPDITSDITTRVIMESLVQFTQAMMREYPQLTRGSRRVRLRMWDATLRRWVDRLVELPAPDGQALVLVPEMWTRANPLIRPSRFHGIAALGYVQDREAAYDRRQRRWIKTPKWVLKQRDDLSEIRLANLRVTLLALAEGQDLLEAFDRYLAEWYWREGRRSA